MVRTRQKRFNEQLEKIKAERRKWSPGGMRRKMERNQLGVGVGSGPLG